MEAYANKATTGRNYGEGAALREFEPEPQESVVFHSVGNLREEVNGLSVQIDMLCGRIGAASRPCAQSASGSDAKLAEPTTSLLTKKIDDQAKRVRMLANQIATALECLEL